MSPDEIAQLISHRVPKAFWLGVQTQLDEAFAKAPALIKKNTNLKAFRAARVAGQLRFALVEQAFEVNGQNLGAENLYKQELPGLPDCVVFQPLQQFVDVIVGFASQPKAGAMPTKNMTRQRAVQLNFSFTDHLDLGEPKVEEPILYVCLLTSADPANPALVGSIEVVVIDPTYDHFIFRESLEIFLKRYSKPKAAEPKQPLTRLRPKPKSKGSGTADGTGS